ncbi:MAG: hypothetical protein CMN72_07795 [Sphingomonas sp.]|nr:hypothetical protein [Sphingomonas sp.]
MTRIRSTLAPYAPLHREPDPDEGRNHARAAWHTHGLVMIRPEWLTNDFDRQLLTTLAETAHGKRGN